MSESEENKRKKFIVLDDYYSNFYPKSYAEALTNTNFKLSEKIKKALYVSEIDALNKDVFLDELINDNYD